MGLQTIELDIVNAVAKACSMGKGPKPKEGKSEAFLGT